MGLKPDQGMTGAACGRVVVFVQLNFFATGLFTPSRVRGVLWILVARKL